MNLSGSPNFNFLKNYGIYFILVIFVIINIFYIDLLPIWDGFWNLQDVLYAINQPFAFKNYLINDHPAFLYAFIFGLTQKIDYGNIYLIHIVLTVIGIIGIFSFYKILLKIFSKKFYVEILLFTLLFTISPLFLSNAVNTTLDFPVTCFSLAMIAALFYDKRCFFLFFALLAIFTKEIGFAIYFTLIVSYVIFLITRKNKTLNKSYLGLLMLPFLAYLLLFLYKNIILNQHFLWNYWNNNYQASKNTFSSIIALFLKFDLTNKYTITKLLQTFVINFNWILSLFVLIFVGEKILVFFKSFIFNKKFRSIHPHIKNINVDFLYIVLFIFIINGVILWNYIIWVNMRYVLPIIPLFIVIAFYCFVILLQKFYKLRIILLSVLISVIFISNFFTIDKVSKDIFNTFSFGEKKMLCMQQLVNLKNCGRDQIIYNLQYTNIIKVLQQTIKKMQLSNDKKLHIVSSVQSKPVFLFWNIDIHKNNFSMLKADEKNIIQPLMYTFNSSMKTSSTLIVNKLQESELPQKINYVKMPMYGNEQNVELLQLKKKGYDIIDNYEIDYHGYQVSLFVLEKIKV